MLQMPGLHGPRLADGAFQTPAFHAERSGKTRAQATEVTRWLFRERGCPGLLSSLPKNPFLETSSNSSNRTTAGAPLGQGPWKPAGGWRLHSGCCGEDRPVRGSLGGLVALLGSCPERQLQPSHRCLGMGIWGPGPAPHPQLRRTSGTRSPVCPSGDGSTSMCWRPGYTVTIHMASKGLSLRMGRRIPGQRSFRERLGSVF